MYRFHQDKSTQGREMKLNLNLHLNKNLIRMLVKHLAKNLRNLIKTTRLPVAILCDCDRAYRPHVIHFLLPEFAKQMCQSDFSSFKTISYVYGSREITRFSITAGPGEHWEHS